MLLKPSIFHDYDIRAIMGEDLDEEGVEKIAAGLVEMFHPKVVAIGYDMRTTSPQIYQALLKGLKGKVKEIWDLGLISTDMSYFVAGYYSGVDLVIMITASHNPAEFNGMKITRGGAYPVGGKDGLYQLRDLLIKGFVPSIKLNYFTQAVNKDVWSDWIKENLKLIDLPKMKHFKVVIDAGNSMAGYFIPKFQKYLPNLEVIPLFFELDGSFPNHIPNPLLPSAIKTVQEKVKEEKADLGVLFDGDGDRMFLMDGKGRLFSGTQTTALLAEHLLDKYPRSLILHNIVTGRVVKDVVEAKGGKVEITPVGHSNIKRIMRRTGALFGGEHSGHYFYRQLYYADNAILSFLLALEYASLSGLSFAQLYDKYAKYPQSGEINFRVDDKKKVIEDIKNHFSSNAKRVLDFDGVRLDYDDYWFNVRASNTQPLLRLNMEADNEEILKQHLAEVLDFLEKEEAERVEE